MSEPTSDPGRRSLALQSAQIFRYVLAGLFALVLFGGPSLPFVGSMAHASGGVSSAPGYMTATVRGNDRFYLVDTNEKIICVYGLSGEALKLFSARRFHIDEKIFDGSVKAPVAIEGRDGVTYEEAEAYLKNTQAGADALKARVSK